MTLKLSMELKNAAFGDTEVDRREEAARLLRNVALQLERGDCVVSPIHDFNGNRVGFVEFVNLDCIGAV